MSPVITIITHQPHKPITKTKKKMDTETVLKIIKMIENNLKVSEENTPITQPAKDYQFVLGRENALQELQDHLQSFIEGQLNALENQAGE